MTIVARPAGGLSGTIDSLDQGASLAIDRVAADGRSVHVDVAAVHGFFDGTLNQQGSQLDGWWTQNGRKQPLAFVRDTASAAASPAQAGVDAPLELLVPAGPVAFRAGGQTHLVYELHVTNFGPRALLLTKVEVFPAAGGAPLASHQGADLTARTFLPGKEPDAAKALLLAGGMRAVVFLWLTEAPGTIAPTSLEHAVTVKADGSDMTLQARGARTPVTGQPVIVGPPLRGGPWAAVNGPSNLSRHRRALMAVGGRSVIAQRLAIDWVRIGGDGKTFVGDAHDNKSYAAYGAEAQAVADGVVALVKDGIPENQPGPTSRAVPITLDTIAGNLVIVNIGRGRFAMFAHLQPGSLRVKVGDAVRRGQVLGLVGNSGNSTEPHLHFQISSDGSPLGGEGLPYAIDAYDVESADGAAPADHRRDELPTQDQRVRFP